MARRNFPLQSSPRDGKLLDGRFEILGLLARGGTSNVYLARDRRNRKFVAVKWLSARASVDPNHRQRFLSGARSIIGLNHPGIAQVICVGEPQGHPPYLVMEALEGESLADYLERELQPGNGFVLMLIREVASGLAAAHDAGVVHRDIKPGNLFLVGPLGAPTGVKIIDFGFSKDMSEDASSPSSRNLVLGTAQYMAPEQVLADPVDRRTDIYALGVVLFRVLTGQLPFDLDPSLELFEHQLFSPVPPLSWLNENIDARLEKLVLRCLHKNPNNRYASTHELLQDLARITSSGLETEPVFLSTSTGLEPDVYRPRNPRGVEVAQSLAEHFGVEPPPPSTSRVETPGVEPVAPSTSRIDAPGTELDFVRGA
jgi:eukaryotic-like serine/threonine-protein kinase